MVQLSHLYMTTGKTIALTVQTFVSKVMSLFFNTLSRILITFLPRRTHQQSVEDEWINKVDPYKGMLQNLKKEGSSDTRSMDGPWGHFAN